MYRVCLLVVLCSWNLLRITLKILGPTTVGRPLEIQKTGNRFAPPRTPRLKNDAAKYPRNPVLL